MSATPQSGKAPASVSLNLTLLRHLAQSGIDLPTGQFKDPACITARRVFLFILLISLVIFNSSSGIMYE
jgi:hypothetical protein